MKSLKLLLLSLSLILSISVASAQNTTVSGTVTDPDGTAWANGNITFTLVGSGGPPFTCSGTQLTPNQVRVNLVLDGTGAFTGSLCSNTNVTPVNSQWQIIVCSATTAPCQNLSPTTVSGGSQSLTTFINNQLTALRISPAYGTTAYADAEILSPPKGATYYNLTANAIKFWNGSVWGTFGGSYVLLSSINVGSAVSEIDVTSVVNSAYNTYEVVIQNLQVSANATVGIQFSNNNGSSYDTGNNYTSVNEVSKIAASPTTITQGGVLKGFIDTAGAAWDTGTPSTMHFMLYNLLSASSPKDVEFNGRGNFGGVPFNLKTWGTYTSATLPNAFRLNLSTGNFTSGSIKIYGRT